MNLFLGAYWFISSLCDFLLSNYLSCEVDYNLHFWTEKIPCLSSYLQIPWNVLLVELEMIVEWGLIGYALCVVHSYRRLESQFALCRLGRVCFNSDLISCIPLLILTILWILKLREYKTSMCLHAWACVWSVITVMFVFFIVCIGMGWVYLVCVCVVCHICVFHCLCWYGLYVSCRAANMRVGLILQNS